MLCDEIVLSLNIRSVLELPCGEYYHWRLLFLGIMVPICQSLQTQLHMLAACGDVCSTEEVTFLCCRRTLPAYAAAVLSLIMTPEVMRRGRRPSLGLQAILEGTRVKPGSISAFVELHIEQGPRLEREGLQLGIVSAIAAPAALRVFFSGDGGHAGALLMPDRHASTPILMA